MNPETFEVFKRGSLDSILNHIEFNEFDTMRKSFCNEGWTSVVSSIYFKGKILKTESLNSALKEVAEEILEHYGLHVGENIYVYDNEKEEIQNSFEGTFTSFTATFDEFYITVTDQDDNVFDITFNPEYFRIIHDTEH
jgi:hypothetical protein